MRLPTKAEVETKKLKTSAFLPIRKSTFWLHIWERKNNATIKKTKKRSAIIVKNENRPVIVDANGVIKMEV